ncbi:hypothetical protein EXIGLDRAFT_35779 [Exidia glandulosa HHB12029]|uniref:Uncharacterized protein n=1 Tax=Exidia glandulosa HHB12029 TaxID=1314781 RepID=A0A165IRU9_EXIGL|nr:hypothetical protein EXIGLDRAFT_35779 [Exidia glandulosa HHB12029]
MIFKLDFADLDLAHASSLDEVEARCASFMKEASRRFYRKYFLYLRRDAAEDFDYADASYSFPGIVYACKRKGYHIFLAIDNYTAPHLDISNGGVEGAIADAVWNPILRFLNEGLIFSGLFVGDDLKTEHTPWAGVQYFYTSTVDVTTRPSLDNAVGITLDEINLLGTVSALPDVGLAAHVVELRRLPHNAAEPLYKARDVLLLHQELVEERHTCTATPGSLGFYEVEAFQPTPTVDVWPTLPLPVTAPLDWEEEYQLLDEPASPQEDERESREDMIAAARAYLTHMLAMEEAAASLARATLDVADDADALENR